MASIQELPWKSVEADLVSSVDEVKLDVHDGGRVCVEATMQPHASSRLYKNFLLLPSGFHQTSMEANTAAVVEATNDSHVLAGSTQRLP